MNLAGVPGVLGASGSRVGHMKDVVAGHSQGPVGPSRERQVDPYVEGVSRGRLVAPQLLQQRLVV